MAKTGKQVRERKMSRQVADRLAKALQEDPGTYHFRITSGPTQPTLLDSLKPYHNWQTVHCFFECMEVDPGVSAEERQKMLEEPANLFYLKVCITGLLLVYVAERQEGLWLLTGKVIGGKYGGKNLVALYQAGLRSGSFDLV